MPIHLDFSHPNRMVAAVVRGPVTVEDMAEAARQFAASGAWHYRKIIDVSSGHSEIDDKGLEMLAAFARANSQDRSRGPLAFVIDPTRPEEVEKYVELTKGERPAKAFRSLHDARRWLDENTTL
jgi:hypothetical protein